MKHRPTAGEPAGAKAEPVAGNGAKASTETDKPAAGNGRTPSDEPTVRRIESAPAQPVDLLDTAGSSVAKRAVPVLIGLVLVWFLLRRRRRRRDR